MTDQTTAAAYQSVTTIYGAPGNAYVSQTMAHLSLPSRFKTPQAQTMEMRPELQDCGAESDLCFVMPRKLFKSRHFGLHPDLECHLSDDDVSPSLTQ